ncbi:MAG TPA: 7-carboxy-7-deazaguanine synthase QueE [Flavisolibacter sp.]|nr:7-carboxy-7-deazaguanine synthase QueE [Flavisolibacter sp.]
MNDLSTISSTLGIVPVTALPIMEHFYTLQGEGVHQGKAAYFIRLGGCDVGCVWCDVKDSWDSSKHPLLEIEYLVEQVKLAGSPIAVITGGEPLLHNLDELTRQLQKAGIRTHMETSGSSPLSGSWDWITLSPKKFKAPLPEVVEKASELKVVVFNKSDFEWAEQWAARVSPECKLYLQPEWDKAAIVTPMIIDYIKAHPQWQLSLQIHKYINVP